MSYWEGEGARSYHHTAPINALYGLHEALIILKEEGIENSWERHKNNHLQLRSGLENMGIKFLVDEEDRLPQLNSIYIPEGVNDLELSTITVKQAPNLLYEFTSKLFGIDQDKLNPKSTKWLENLRKDDKRGKIRKSDYVI